MNDTTFDATAFELATSRSRSDAGTDAARSIKIRGAGKSFDAVAAISDIDLDVSAGEIRAIIGPNGAGKSTLLNLISGLYGIDRGTIEVGLASGKGLRSRDLARLGIARTFQHLALFPGLNVEQNVAMGRRGQCRASTVERLFGIGRVRHERRETSQKVDAILSFLELDHVRTRSVGDLAYGLQKRVEFARAIVGEPTILLLDEPMAGMSADDKAVLARLIRATRDTFGTTILLIEHDVDVVMRLADRIAVLDRGRKIADGTPSAIHCDPVVIEAYLGSSIDDADIAA